MCNKSVQINEMAENAVAIIRYDFVCVFVRERKREKNGLKSTIKLHIANK